jgi:tRNA nucleotidyltransferase (CCA-adding enzyme)
MGLNRYLVGGAVRDRLLGLPGGDRDWVVVGSTPEAMLAAGFRPVGSDFPVFLHPETKEEHALARTERKSGRGYKGFEFYAGPEVTLEEDLRRRDFTINAMAMDCEGRLIDPWGGQADLEARVLRHVSPAFAEDPLRVLRAARFMARLKPLGFRVAPETVELMRGMVDQGEIDHLVPERVWHELRRALVAPRPSAFLQTLRECGALRRILPEVDALYGVPQSREYHPEVDTGIHTEMVIDQCPRLAPGDDAVAYAALVHDLGKALTPREEWPRHVAHEARGLAPVRAVSTRLRVPREHQALALLVCEHHLVMHRLLELRPGTLLRLLERLDGLRKPDRVARFALACAADARGRLGLEERPYPQHPHLLAALAAARQVDARALLERGLAGPAIAQALHQARVAAIAELRSRR